jgi:hypothetical protein
MATTTLTSLTAGMGALEMASHHGRFYALALGLVVFFLTWAIVAAHPWAAATPDPRLRALAVREAQLRREATIVRKTVAARWARYRVQLKLRRAQIANAAAASAAASAAAASASAAQQTQAAAPAVRVINLPAHVITRTS